MGSRSRSDAPSPSPMGSPYYQQPRYVPSGINWTNVPFGPNDAPEGRWGKNAAGDSYIACADGSYHYFNTDGSYYYSDGKPGKAKAKGESIYVSPRSERFYTPPDTFLGQGEYFIGRHWQTGIENIYWEHGDGSIERTFRKNVDVENQKLNWEYIAEKNYRPIVVDQYGNPSGRSQHSFMPQGREQVGMEVTAGWQMQSQSTAVAEIPPTPRKSRGGGCPCIIM